MIEKQLFHAVLSRLTHGGVKVVYWDGDERRYGPNDPYYTLRITTPKVVRAMLKNISLGFGEAYTDGLIEVDGPLTAVVRLREENKKVFDPLAKALASHLHKNTRRTQKRYIAHHYDIGNDFYRLWLDKSLTYSCAYFKTPKDSLELAQQQKVGYILGKLYLQKGQRLLDIGSGWGTLLITAAKKYGVQGLGITLSEQQLAHSRAAAIKAGVADRVTFELANYQDLASRPLQFDRIVSVGMFEHVGQGNHAHYYRAVQRLLAEGGVSVLHSITQQVEMPNDPWIDKYIFPGGYLPSTREIVAALPSYDLHLIDYENLRLHYAMTLEEWTRRYQNHQKEITAMFDERFYRMWHLWLASSAASFRYGAIDLSQFVFTKGVQNDLPLTRESWYGK